MNSIAKHPFRRSRSLLLGSTLALSLAPQAWGAGKDLGNGFRDLGVAVPISNHRGTVATTDGSGHNVLLSYVMDHRGGYELLMLDAQTGKAEQFPIPFKNSKGDSPYASILSSHNRFYTHFGDHFMEFDPAKRAFTFSSKTTPQMAMGMTEDDKGVIWSVTYPQSGLVSYDPATRQFRDYGHVYEQTWPQYQRFMAADDSGWIYFALGMTESQIVAFDPATSSATPMLAPNERKKGTAYVYRDLDGKVYGHAGGEGKDSPKEEWYEFHQGKGHKIGEHTVLRPKPIITGSQILTHYVFPDGSLVKSFNLVERKLAIEDAGTSKVREMSFDYTSDGAIVMGVALSPDNTICGGTAFPMRFFRYDPKQDNLLDRLAYGQWNTVTRQGDRFFVGAYAGGFLLEWDPSKPWVNTDVKNDASNPRFLMKTTPVIHRPHCLLATADGKRVIMGGTPEYGYTGGGLLIWDREKRTHVLLKDTDLIPDQSTLAVVQLPNGKLLGGTTTEPGTGGQKKANLAELYTLDLASSMTMDWHAPVFPKAQEYTTLWLAPDGLVYGFVDSTIFFVFDPAKKSIVHQQNIEAEFGPTVHEQGPRIFVTAPGNRLYVLLEKGIARLETPALAAASGSSDKTSYKFTWVAKSPLPLKCGGDYLDGRLYFACGSHLCSYQLDPPSRSK